MKNLFKVTTSGPHCNCNFYVIENRFKDVEDAFLNSLHEDARKDYDIIKIELITGGDFLIVPENRSL